MVRMSYAEGAICKHTKNGMGEQNTHGIGASCTGKTEREGGDAEKD